MSKVAKRLALAVVLFAGAALSAYASGPFVTPVGIADTGSIVVVPVFIGGMPLGVAVVPVG